MSESDRKKLRWKVEHVQRRENLFSAQTNAEVSLICLQAHLQSIPQTFIKLKRNLCWMSISHWGCCLCILKINRCQVLAVRWKGVGFFSSFQRKEEKKKKTSRRSKVNLVTAPQQGPKHLICTAFNAQVLLSWLLRGCAVIYTISYQ